MSAARPPRAGSAQGADRGGRARGRDRRADHHPRTARHPALGDDGRASSAPTSPWSPGPTYHHGVRALANSLRRVSSIPLLALCTADADQAASDGQRDPRHRRARDRQPQPDPADAGRFAATYTKLNVFRLDFLDRLVYLDGDTVVLQNIDDLFAGDDFAAAPDAGLDRASGQIFNSGVFAVTPCARAVPAPCSTGSANTASYDGGDQGFLNNIFPDWRRLPQEYNTTKRIFAHHPALVQRRGGQGPALRRGQAVGAGQQPVSHYDELDLRWLEFLEDWELRELTRSLRDQAGVLGSTRLHPDRGVPAQDRAPAAQGRARRPVRRTAGGPRVGRPSVGTCVRIRPRASGSRQARPARLRRPPARATCRSLQLRERSTARTSCARATRSAACCAAAPPGTAAPAARGPAGSGRPPRPNAVAGACR